MEEPRHRRQSCRPVVGLRRPRVVRVPLPLRLFHLINLLDRHRLPRLTNLLNRLDLVPAVPVGSAYHPGSPEREQTRDPRRLSDPITSACLQLLYGTPEDQDWFSQQMLRTPMAYFEP